MLDQQKGDIEMEAKYKDVQSAVEAPESEAIFS
jgi:hypothetical protein